MVFEYNLFFCPKVGWKFTSLAGQKASELSENVTEKVKKTKPPKKSCFNSFRVFVLQNKL